MCHRQLSIERYFNFHLYLLHVQHGRLFYDRHPYVLSVEMDILQVIDFFYFSFLICSLHLVLIKFAGISVLPEPLKDRCNFLPKPYQVLKQNHIFLFYYNLVYVMSFSTFKCFVFPVNIINNICNKNTFSEVTLQ